MKQIIIDILLISSGLLASYRAFKVENYFRLLDNQEKIKYTKHLANSFGSFEKSQKWVAFFLPRFIFKKSNFETERRNINIFTSLIFILLIPCLILSLIIY